MLNPPIPKTTDAIDVIIEAAQRMKEVTDEHGIIHRVAEPDNESLWWKTQLVNSPQFASLAQEIVSLENYAKEAKNNMCQERAMIIEMGIMSIVQSYKYGIDAKSSETLRDKNNSQSSLVHVLTRNHMERSITMNGEAKRGFMQGFLGRDDQQQQEY